MFSSLRRQRTSWRGHRRAKSPSAAPSSPEGGHLVRLGVLSGYRPQVRRKLIEAKIDDAHDLKWRNKRAVTMLRALHDAYRTARGAAAGNAEFAAYVAELRDANNREPASLRLLDEAGFPG